MYMTGTLLQGVCNIASGFSQTGPQLITFRGLAGLAVSFSLPSATAVITETFPPGNLRNISFACMGGGQPIGFALGLTLGGVLAQWNWRYGFFLPAILNFALFIVAWFAIPKDNRSRASMGSRLVHDIDWVGALLASTALAMISYVFA
jgi:MFS family permease